MRTCSLPQRAARQLWSALRLLVLPYGGREAHALWELWVELIVPAASIQTREMPLHQEYPHRPASPAMAASSPRMRTRSRIT